MIHDIQWLKTSPQKIASHIHEILCPPSTSIDLDGKPWSNISEPQQLWQMRHFIPLFYANLMTSFIVNPFSAKRSIIITTRRVPSLLGVAETF